MCVPHSGAAGAGPKCGCRAGRPRRNACYRVLVENPDDELSGAPIYAPAMGGTLEAIHVYPVKSCAAVALDRAEITGTGLRGDRLFQVVDIERNPVTQRQQP